MSHYLIGYLVLIIHGGESVNNFFKKLSLFFSAGSLGGFVNSLFVWLFGILGITSAFGVEIAPALTKSWLYPRIVWGGLWGFLFLLPFFRGSYFFRGLLFSLGPTLVQLFIVFPIQAGKGLMGVDLGNLTPLFVLFFNAVWGLATVIWLKFIQGEKRDILKS
jgi:hypothetical protein